MSFSDRTMTEPYTSREVSTVPGEGDANLLLQDSKAAAPYSTSSCAALLHIHTKQPFKILQKILFL